MVKFNIYVFGTGTYVSGRGTDGYGTILPALIEWIRKKQIKSNISLIGTNSDHSNEAREKAISIRELTGVPFQLNVFPENGEKNPKYYKNILKTIKQPACGIVAVPDHLHYDITLACLEAGLHTLVVKPFTPTVNEGMKLIKVAENNKLYGAVEFHKRWDRANIMLKDIIENGSIGVPLYSWVEYSQRKSIPSKVFKSWVNRTNVLQYLGVHYIDIIRFITGAIPVRTMAIGQKHWLKSRRVDVHDSIQCMIEWKIQEHIFHQTILTNWIDPKTTSAMSQQKINLVGTKGRFQSDQKDRGIELVTDSSNLEVPNPDFCRQYGVKRGEAKWLGYGIESITTFLDDVIAIIDGSMKPSMFEGLRPTFKESLISTSVLESASKSLYNNGNWYEVDIFD